MIMQTRVPKMDIILMIPIFLLLFIPPSNAATFDCIQQTSIHPDECKALVDLFV